MTETETHNLHLAPKYPVKPRDILQIVRGIAAAREVIIASTVLEFPEEFSDPSHIREEVRGAEERGEPVWIVAHDSFETLAAARDALRKIDSDSRVILDWEEGEEFEDEDVEEDELVSDSHFQTALVLLQQADGNPLQAAANAHGLANAAEDPSDLFCVIGILIETFPWIHAGLKKAGIIDDAADG